MDRARIFTAPRCLRRGAQLVLAIFHLSLVCPYRPLFRMFYHSHKLTKYRVIRLIKFIRYSLRNVTAPKGDIQPNPSFFCFTF